MNINGIELFIEMISGKGNLNFVCIHNAGGSHLFFSHQIECLKKYGNIILLDLPGHGNSELISHFNMHSLSCVIRDICNTLDLKNIILIGLNNGANIAIETVIAHTLPIRKIVLIDPLIFMKESLVNEILYFFEQLEKTNYSSFIDSLVNELFIQTDEKNKTIARNAFNSVDKHVLQNIFKELIEWDKQSHDILNKINCPTLCILTDEHHCTYQKIVEEAPHFEIGKVIGSNCWATLEVPDQVNAMIERFIVLS